MTKRKENTKGKIVTAAWNLFYKQGYEDTTIEEIVEVSGTSKGSFYHYFESKDALLGSLSYLFDEKYEELEEKISPDTNCFDVLIFLNQELFGMIDNQIDQDLISRLYSSQLVMRGEKSLLDNNRIYYRLLKQIVVRGQERGELSKQYSVNDIVRLYAMCERAMICEWCLCGWTFSLKSFSAQHLPMMLSGIKENSEKK